MAPRKNRLRVIKILLAAPVLAGIALPATSVGTSASASSAPRTVTAATGTVASSVTSSGNVSAPQSLAVSFKSSGTVTVIDVAVGQQVTQGQILARVDPTTAQQNLAVAQAN